MENNNNSLECKTIDECKQIYLHSNGYSNLMSKEFTLQLIFSLCILFGFIGFVFNLICAFIFSNKNFNSKFYKILRIYSLNSCLLNLNDFVMFFSAVINFKEFTVSYKASFYICYVYVTIAVTLYTFGGIFDIVIVLERLSILSNKFKYLEKWTPGKLAIIVMISSLFINIPLIFSRQPIKIAIKLNETQIIYFYNYINTPFFYRRFGTIIIHLNLLIRDILTLIVEIALNLLSLFYLKRLLVNKKKLTLQNQLKLSLIDKIDENSTKMVVLMCTLAAFVHFCVYYSWIISRKDKMNSKMIGVIAFLIATIKFSLNFLVFYFYNQNFKDNVNKLFLKIRIFILGILCYNFLNVI